MKTYGDIRPGDLLIWFKGNGSSITEAHLVVGLSKRIGDRLQAADSALVSKRHFCITLLRCHGNRAEVITQYWWDPELPLYDNMMVIR